MDNVIVSHLVCKDFRTAESLKVLRTNLLFSGENMKVIGLTSFSASEGKSTISFQLAATLAEAGKRVLLMDADLRKSVLQSRLRFRAKISGLSHYLSGMADVDETLIPTDVSGLYIMFAGTLVPNAAELFGGERFKKMIPALKNAFDYVIVDAAPLGQVIDCAIMAPELDGTVIVIDATHNSYKLIRRIQGQLERSGGKILGVVLNRVDFSDKSSYYGKAYGDNYGYGEDQK